MPKTTMTTDTALFKKQVRELARLTGRNVSEVMVQQVGIVGGSLMRAFPPLKKGGDGKKPRQSKKQGEYAIENDARRIFNTDAKELNSFDLAIQAGVSQADTVVRAVRTKSGAAYVVDRAFYRPYASYNEMKNHHDRQRNSRGRVTKAAAKGHDRYIGRWKAIDKMYVNERVFQNYIKQRSKKVGSLAAGWKPTAKLNKTKRGIAGWIDRHPAASSSVRNNMNRQTGDGYILFSNKDDRASNWRSINDHIVKQNNKRMVKALKYEYKKALEKASFRDVAFKRGVR